jgi:serine/threonine protein kinase
MSQAPKDARSESAEFEHWTRIKALFGRALELTPEQRTAFLRQECEEDPIALAAVQRLLLHDDQAGSFLEEPVFGALRTDSTFAPGQLIANRFIVTRLIGHGGMGEVYEAEDRILCERVAIKTIRREIANYDELNVRFRQELQLARQVSHPNVCRVFELWEHKEDNAPRIAFLTMELLCGETLAERLSRVKKLAADETLEFSRQIAEGLFEIHRLGIVHRDLKPSNLHLIPEENGQTRVVLTDFGLARMANRIGPSVTQTGKPIGTPAYMAPELFERGEATFASDIYAFGVTIFEMATGQRHPLMQPSKVAPELGPQWNEAICQCWDLKPENRPPDALSVVRMLAPRSKSRSGWRALAATAAAALLLLGGIGIWVKESGTRGKPAVLSRVTVDSGLSGNPSVSDDGNLLVYYSDRADQNFDIWIQNLSDGSTRQLTDNPAHETEPAISPDGQWVVYRSEQDGGGIYMIGAKGGPARLLAKDGRNPRFSPDGKLVLYWTGQPGDHSMPSGRIWRIPAGGGSAEQLAPDFADARLPAWSFDGNHILFRGAKTATPSLDDASDWWVTSLNGREVVKTGALALFRQLGLWLHDSTIGWDRKRVIFAARSGHSTNLWSVALNAPTFRPTVPPERLTTSVDFEVSPWICRNGSILFATLHAEDHVWRVSTQTGALIQTTTEDSMDARPSVSLDGKLLAYARRLGEARDVWLKEVETGKQHLIARDRAAIPYVSPDGKAVAYSVTGSGTSSITLQPVPNGVPKTVCKDCGDLIGWIPDSRGVMYLRIAAGRPQAIRSIDVSSGRDVEILAGGEFDQASLAPSGDRIAFTVRQSGIATQIYVAPLRNDHPTGRTEWVPLTDGRCWDDKPRWSPDSRTIFFYSDRDGNGCIWKQDVQLNGLRPSGPALALSHLHTSNPSTMYLSRPAFSLSAARDWVYFNAGKMTGNIWALKQ